LAAGDPAGPEEPTLLEELYARVRAVRAQAGAVRAQAGAVRAQAGAVRAQAGAVRAASARRRTNRSQSFLIHPSKSGKSGLLDLNGRLVGSYVAAVHAPEIRWETLGGRIIEARYHRRMSRAQLARRAGYRSQSTVIRYENGEAESPQEEVVFRFADALGCNPLWLMYGRGVPGWKDDWK
jgi:ribosome-binding protein aMBF1 (putative translation factor)